MASTDLKPTDAELVQSALKNSEVFGQIIERYEAKLTRYLSYLTRLSGEAIEEILQEAFLKVYRNLNGYDPKLPFSSWIYRIAHNEALNHLKYEKRRQAVSLEAENDDGIKLYDTLKSELNITEEMDQKMLAEQVWKALDLLPEKYREVLVLKFIADKDYLEISDILKKPMGTVGTLINRAKENFRQTFIKNRTLE